MRLLLAILGMVTAFGGCSRSSSSETGTLELTVYAAASLRDVMQEIADEYGRSRDVKVVFNFGSSGDLARQIIAARRADLFFSADQKEMDRVEAAKILLPGSRRDLLANRLAIIAPKESASDRKDLFDGPFKIEQLENTAIRRISLANVETVPAGRYAKAWLEGRGLWTTVAPRVLPGVDVRAALGAVESGGADVGIVFATDAARSAKVRVLFEVPVEEGPKITYPLGVIDGRPARAEAERFAEFLAADRARDVFKKHGFLVLEKAVAVDAK